jgi:GNAT superfamily N-acetyltransferase
MASDVTIRRARRVDGKGFVHLLLSLAKFEKLEPPTSAARRRILRDIFQRKVVSLFLAICQGRPVGYALYFYTYSSFLARPTLYLEDIFVAQPFRGKGVGAELFRRCVKQAILADCGRMEWAVLGWNINAIEFYENVGARRLDEWHNYRLDRRERPGVAGWFVWPSAGATFLRGP